MSEMEKDQYNVKLPWFGLPRIWPYVRQSGRDYLWMMTTNVATVVVQVIQPMFSQYAINHFILAESLDGLGRFIAVYLILLLASALLNYICIYMGGRVEMNTDRALRSASFSHLQELSFSYFNQNNVGYIHSRIMSDTSKIGEMIAWNLMDLVFCFCYILFASLNMFRLNAGLAAIIVAVLPVAAVIMYFYQQKQKVRNHKIRDLNSKISAAYNEGITGARSIKTLVIEEPIEAEFRDLNQKMEKTSRNSWLHRAAFSSIVSLFSYVCVALVMWQGGLLTQANAMLVGTLYVFVNYSLEMMDTLEGLTELFSRVVETQVNIERFSKLMDTRSDVVDTPEVIEKYGDTFHPKKENWEPLYGDIEFRDVSFHYPDGQEMVLEHFDLKVPKGTNIAIVGETGAGKSTLVNLVCRFYEPTSGQVLIDGRDARERSQLWLHSNIGYVLQDPHLFSGTVRDNLRYGKPDATDEQIWEALKLVDAQDIVSGMEKGLDSDVGEGGSVLSTGEKQLLSFARAILADPRILVLDEATASVDTLTEKVIQDAIFKVIKGRTSFVIAHRLSTIVDADEILVVSDGKIIERGTHGELMRKKGYYYDLYTRQYEELATDMAS